MRSCRLFFRQDFRVLDPAFNLRERSTNVDVPLLREIRWPSLGPSDANRRERRGEKNLTTRPQRLHLHLARRTPDARD